MLRALLLLACTAKVAAFAQTPPGCVDVDWGVLQSAYTGDPADSLAMVFEVEDSEDVEDTGAQPVVSAMDEDEMAMARKKEGGLMAADDADEI